MDAVLRDMQIDATFKIASGSAIGVDFVPEFSQAGSGVYQCSHRGLGKRDPTPGTGPWEINAHNRLKIVTQKRRRSIQVSYYNAFANITNRFVLILLNFKAKATEVPVQPTLDLEMWDDQMSDFSTVISL